MDRGVRRPARANATARRAERALANAPKRTSTGRAEDEPALEILAEPMSRSAAASTGTSAAPIHSSIGWLPSIGERSDRRRTHAADRYRATRP
jgi:hypothetical protein